MLDTRTKRCSAIGLALASMLVLPADLNREALAYSYSGIQAIVQAAVVIVINTFSPTILITQVLSSIGSALGIGSAQAIDKPPDVIVTVPGIVLLAKTYAPRVVLDVVVNG